MPLCMRWIHARARPGGSRSRVSNRGRAGHVFARPGVFATTRVFARPGFGTCHRPPTCLCDDACPRPTCLRDVSSRRHMPSPDLSSATVFSRERGFTTGSALAGAVRSRGVFGRPRVFAPRRVLSEVCLQTPTCLRCLRLACVC